MQKTEKEVYSGILAYLVLRILFYLKMYFIDPDLISDSSISINQ